MAKDDSQRLTFYFPGLRVLRPDEIEVLPDRKRKAAAASGRQGVWLEVPCPKEACFKGEDKVCIDVLPAGHESGRGLWLNVFCPESSCLITSGTDLP
jgi:hypothetical protein